MAQEWICSDEEETANIARNIADNLEYPCIILLEGDLGAGKTAFCRAFIRYMVNDGDLNVPSPTYTFVQTYHDEQIWHFDLYRMDNPQDIYDLGWEEALSAKLCLIEWPIRLGDLKPQTARTIIIEALPNESRRITLTP
jgi:tRNA threonylcarbamoyladenosine biosynthesis protein TsaE